MGQEGCFGGRVGGRCASHHLGGSWEGIYSYMLFDNPAWDLATVNFDFRIKDLRFPLRDFSRKRRPFLIKQRSD